MNNDRVSVIFVTSLVGRKWMKDNTGTLNRYFYANSGGLSLLGLLPLAVVLFWLSVYSMIMSRTAKARGVVDSLSQSLVKRRCFSIKSLCGKMM